MRSLLFVSALLVLLALALAHNVDLDSSLVERQQAPTKPTCRQYCFTGKRAWYRARAKCAKKYYLKRCTKRKSRGWQCSCKIPMRFRTASPSPMTMKPSMKPSMAPSMAPSSKPSMAPSVAPSTKPSMAPSAKPSTPPSPPATPPPTTSPSSTPTVSPSPMAAIDCPIRIRGLTTGGSTKSYRVDLKKKYGRFRFEYNFYQNFADKIVLKYDGKVIYNTGTVTGTAVTTIEYGKDAGFYTGTSTFLTVEVSAPNGSSAWSFLITCP